MSQYGAGSERGAGPTYLGMFFPIPLTVTMPIINNLQENGTLGEILRLRLNFPLFA